MALSDGHRLEILAQAEDHKTIFDGDRGPNTGGMGTVSPAAWASSELLSRIATDVLAPTLSGLQAEGIDFRGVLYAGLMVDESGTPWLLEYNCRFGDPETQPVMLRLEGDLGNYLCGAAKGHMPETPLFWDERVAVCVVLAAPGYPLAPETGQPIAGLDNAFGPDVAVFHAGTKSDGDGFVTGGGRVLGIVAAGVDVREARDRAYEAVARVSFAGMQYRRDIGARGV